MSEHVHVVPLGAATVRVINVADLRLSLPEEMDVPESEWRPRYAAFFERPQRCPMQDVHIALPDLSLLVDASEYDLEPDSEYALPDYVAPPGLLARLGDAGIQPEDVARVVITHSHFDHINGTTIERDGAFEPAFPYARYLIGREEWEDEDTQTALGDPTSLVSQTLAVLRERGQLELVEGDLNLGNGVRLIHAPGETQGHHIVRVESEGKVLYCLGDLFHHQVEVEQPQWTMSWADQERILASRRALIEAALAEDALLVAAHIPGVGRLERTDEGVRWAAVAMA
jgi:glyoxylase-like metal-dependent hydrolase (beta-lactamase superfamily II)